METFEGKANVKTVNGQAPDSRGNVNVKEYSHPNSGVTADTYRKVTVNAQGHVTKGENPTLAISEGGTGATTAAGACKNLGAVRSVNGVSADANGNVTLDTKKLLGLPDYASYIQVSKGDFTPSTNGWLRLNLTNSSDHRSFTVKHKSSGNIILQYGQARYPGYGLFMCPVIADETYTISSSETQIYFHKVKS